MRRCSPPVSHRNKYGVPRLPDALAYFERNQATPVQMVQLVARLREQYPAGVVAREVDTMVQRYSLPAETTKRATNNSR